MLFGLFNTSASFQGYINKILAKKLNIFVHVHLDDILIYIENPGQTSIEAMQWVLNFLQKYRLFANPKKSWFHKNELRFPEYIISSQEIRIKDKKINVVKNWHKLKLV